MKKITAYLLTAVTAIALLNACGPSEEDQQRQEQLRQQAVQDSLERQRLLWQQQMDSIAAAQAQAAQADSMAETEEEPAQISVQFNPNGAFSVQVEAWRSSEKAEAQIATWVARGFPDAYVVMHGNEATGDVWFRVRLGRVSTLETALSLGTDIQNEYGEEYWIAMVRDEQPAGME